MRSAHVACLLLLLTANAAARKQRLTGVHAHYPLRRLVLDALSEVTHHGLSVVAGPMARDLDLVAMNAQLRPIVVAQGTSGQHTEAFQRREAHAINMLTALRTPEFLRPHWDAALARVCQKLHEENSSLLANLLKNSLPHPVQWVAPTDPRRFVLESPVLCAVVARSARRRLRRALWHEGPDHLARRLTDLAAAKNTPFEESEWIANYDSKGHMVDRHGALVIRRPDQAIRVEAHLNPQEIKLDVSVVGLPQTKIALIAGSPAYLHRIDTDRRLGRTIVERFTPERGLWSELIRRVRGGTWDSEGEYLFEASFDPGRRDLSQGKPTLIENPDYDQWSPVETSRIAQRLASIGLTIAEQKDLTLTLLQEAAALH